MSLPKLEERVLALADQLSEMPKNPLKLGLSQYDNNDMQIVRCFDPERFVSIAPAFDKLCVHLNTYCADYGALSIIVEGKYIWSIRVLSINYRIVIHVFDAYTEEFIKYMEIPFEYILADKETPLNLPSFDANAPLKLYLFDVHPSKDGSIWLLFNIQQLGKGLALQVGTDSFLKRHIFVNNFSQYQLEVLGLAEAIQKLKLYGPETGIQGIVPVHYFESTFIIGDTVVGVVPNGRATSIVVFIDKQNKTRQIKFDHNWRLLSLMARGDGELFLSSCEGSKFFQFV